jgi:dipeptidyl aminopeptidase/acylaminoacyl peptidase
MRQFRRAAVTLLLGAALSVSAWISGVQTVSAQEPVFAVPASIRTEGIPPIPQSLADAVAPYGTFRQARLLDWHPTERRMLVGTAFGNVEQVHEVRGPRAARTQLTFFRDGITAGGAWYAPDGRSFIIRKDGGGGSESYQLFRYDTQSGGTSQLTHGNSTVYFPVWASRKPLVAYTSTRRDGKNRDIYVMDPADPQTDRLVAEVEGSWSVEAWSADDSELLAVESISSSENYLWRVDVASGRKTPLTERGQAISWRQVESAPNGLYYALGNRLADTRSLWRVDPAKGTWTAVTQPADLIEGFSVSPDGRTIAVVVDRGSWSQLLLLDAANGRVRTTPRMPAGVISGLSWRPNGTEVAFTFSGSSSIRDVYSLEAAGGQVQRWTASEAGGASPDALPEAEVFEWKSFDGLSIGGVLYRPPSRFTGKRPVIINVHGGPVDRERPRFLGRSNYFRNEMGIAIIYPNVRGSFGRGKQFEELDNGPLRVNAVKDIGTLLDWIATEPTLDKDRVMIVGASYGGYLTLAAAIEYGDRLRCAQAGFAISDFPSYLESTDVARLADRNIEYGDPADPASRGFLTALSPLTNAARLKIPLFLVHGGKDTRVPPAQAEMMVQAVKKNGTPLWYAVFEQAGHQQLTAETANFNQYAWTMFVQQYLMPGPVSGSQ